MATTIFRVTVRGRFDGLSDEVRDRLVAAAAEHDHLMARFDATGTLVYDKAIDFFSFRIEVRVQTDDADPPAAATRAAFEGATARAVAVLDGLGAGYRDLKPEGTDMADVWR